jgi:hypothetical protein
MERNNGSLLLSEMGEEEGVRTEYRLLSSFDGFREEEVYSVFLTTEYEGERTEDFVYDISRDFGEAKSFFDLLCRNDATATHLRDIAEDFLGNCRDT